MGATSPEAFEPRLASSLINLSMELSGAGRREEALAAIEEAVKLYRRLMETTPAAFGPALLRSLDEKARRLSEMGRREEAWGVATEAREVIARLSRPASA